MVELTTVIPVRNGERFLPETLEFLARQQRRPDRVVVLDNQSTDSTPELVRRFAGLPCEYRRNETDLGVIGNLNRGLELAPETRFLHLLMADDLVEPAFFSDLLPPLAGLPGPGLGYCLNLEVDDRNAVTGPRVRRPDGPARRVPLREFLVRHSELHPVLLPGVVFRTDGLPAPCRFRDYPQLADGLFLAEWAARTGHVVEVPRYHCRYRIHAASATRRHLVDLEHFVSDEWRVMDTIRPWIPEGPVRRGLRAWRLKALFAARTAVKRRMLLRLDRADLAAACRQRAATVAGRTLVGLAEGVVSGRDLLRRLTGRLDRADELLQQSGS